MDGPTIQLQYPSMYLNGGVPDPLAQQQAQEGMITQQPKTNSDLLREIANQLTSPRGQLMYGLPVLAITVVVYFAFVEKRIAKWPWYAKFFTWIAIYGVLQTITSLVSFALPGPQDENADVNDPEAPPV